MKSSTKGSKYIGVYRCFKTKMYYSKNFKNKKCYKSKLFKNEIEAAKKYDNFVIKHFKKKTKKINFPQLFKKTNKLKRPKILEYVKIIIYSNQDDKCALCKKSLGIGRIIDHIIPRSLGGLDNINNYQAICGSCNKWKTYRFDHFIKNYLKNNKKFNLDTILKIQKTEFQKFNGPYPF